MSKTNINNTIQEETVDNGEDILNLMDKIRRLKYKDNI